MKTIVAKGGSEAQDAGAFIMKEQPIPEPGTQDLLVRVIAMGMTGVKVECIFTIFERCGLLT